MTQLYPIEVFWSDEDSVWIANVPDLSFCSGPCAKLPSLRSKKVEIAVEADLAGNGENSNDSTLPTPSRKSLGA